MFICIQGREVRAGHVRNRRRQKEQTELAICKTLTKLMAAILSSHTANVNVCMSAVLLNLTTAFLIPVLDAPPPPAVMTSPETGSTLTEYNGKGARYRSGTFLFPIAASSFTHNTTLLLHKTAALNRPAGRRHRGIRGECWQ